MKRNIIMAAVLVVLLVGATAPATAMIQSENNTTSTATETPMPTASPTLEGCDPGENPTPLQQADLHTSDETIAQGDPGVIEGAIVQDITAECPVRVQITMNVPNNMYIEGGRDVQSGGGGIITSTFTVQPGEAKDIAADVYGTETGEHTVITDITYFPVGHKDMAREIDGLTLSFTVEEPVEAPDSGSSSDGDSRNQERNTPQDDTTTLDDNFPLTLPWLLGIVTITVVGLIVVVGRKNSLTIRK